MKIGKKIISNKFFYSPKMERGFIKDLVINLIPFMIMDRLLTTIKKIYKDEIR